MLTYVQESLKAVRLEGEQAKAAEQVLQRELEQAKAETAAYATQEHILQQKEQVLQRELARERESERRREAQAAGVVKEMALLKEMLGTRYICVLIC